MITNRPEEHLAEGSLLSTDRGYLEVVRASPHQGRYIVSLAGVAGRDAAEDLRDTVLRAPAPEPDGETLWVHQLIGAEVLDRTGASHGQVVAVEANPASDLLVLADGRLVPLVFVVSHIPGREVVVDPPAGLLD